MAMPTRNPLKLLAIATANIARPYTIDAMKTKIFLRPVRSESLPAMSDGLGECAEEYLLRHVGHSGADFGQQEVGLVGGQEGVRQNEHEATGEGPSEVGACPRFDVEGAGEFPQRTGRPARLGKPTALQRDGEEQDEEPASRARDQERSDRVAGESLTRKVPVTDAIGRQTPRTPETRPRCARGPGLAAPPPGRRAVR